MKYLIRIVSFHFLFCLALMSVLITPAYATISVSQQTGIATEGWDGPGLGSATIQWYLGWNDTCAAGDRGVTADGGLTRAQVEAAITAAMNTWSSVVDVNFVKVGDSSLPGNGCIGNPAADIWNCDGDMNTYQINIIWAAGDHCDGPEIAFDGPWNPTTNTGSVFGHSWGPPDIWGFVNRAFVGNIHLDDGDNWVTSGATDVGGYGSGLTSVFVDIQSEVLHELGHSLGLAHPPYGTDSIMEALSWNLEDRVLTAYDIGEIRKLYAVPSRKPGVVLLFDQSGSMGWDADGNPNAPVELQRLSLAKRAAKPFMELLNAYGANVAEFAIAGFTSAAGGCNGHTLSPMTVINAASLQAAISESPPGTIDSMNASGSTPLLAGLDHARGLFTDQDKKAIVLLSDGYHNCPSQVSVGDAALNTVINQLNAGNIVVDTIGFGRPSDIDHPLLETLAASTNLGGVPGNFYDVTVAGFNPANFDQATALTDTYKNILVDHLGLETALDPLGMATAGSVLNREVKISPYDKKVSFFVSWKTPVADRLLVEVRASDDQPVPASGAGITVRSGSSYFVLTVDKSFLTQPGKVGNVSWKLQVKANNFKKGEKEPFQYSVIMDSMLKLKAMMQSDAKGTGSKIKVRASVRAGNMPVRGLEDVYLEVLSPDQSIGTWFAENKVAAGDLDRSSVKTNKNSLSPLSLKALYLTQKLGVKFPGLKVTPGIRLYDDATHGDQTGGDGVYTNTFNDTAKDGTYTLRVHASGALQQGGVFEREASVKKYIPAQFNPDTSTVTVARLSGKQIAVSFTPRDALNNYVGPGYAGAVHLAAGKAEAVGTIKDNLDGTYTQIFKLSDGAKAGVDIKASIGDGSKSITWIGAMGTGLSEYLLWLLGLIILVLLIIILFRLFKNS